MFSSQVPDLDEEDNLDVMLPPLDDSDLAAFNDPIDTFFAVHAILPMSTIQTPIANPAPPAEDKTSEEPAKPQVKTNRQLCAEAVKLKEQKIKKWEAKVTLFSSKKPLSAEQKESLTAEMASRKYLQRIVGFFEKKEYIEEALHSYQNKKRLGIINLPKPTKGKCLSRVAHAKRRERVEGGRFKKRVKLEEANDSPAISLKK